MDYSLKPDDWDRILDVARDLFAKGNISSNKAEFYYRSACSRAYYAAFHCAKYWGINNGEIINTILCSEHSYVINIVHNNYPKLSIRLKTMKDNRVKADYFSEKRKIDYQELAKDTIYLSENFCSSLINLPVLPVKKNI